MACATRTHDNREFPARDREAARPHADSLDDCAVRRPIDSAVGGRIVPTLLVFCQIARPILASLSFGLMGAPNARGGARRAVLCSIVVLALTTISSSMRSEVGTRIQIAGGWGVDL